MPSWEIYLFKKAYIRHLSQQKIIFSKIKKQTFKDLLFILYFIFIFLLQLIHPDLNPDHNQHYQNQNRSDS